ncbi:DNA (cytosine-5)-methyltransferase 3-like [Hemicordylus capensis]|uniref:DNA (cytosine-5)-methyltransferase 3-like n=1 Tax=Hemicordylus capensis TaxID=884348 RepID=UPI0023035022|nr:DNA (cytosine-5)-methyltransferase 3-like [Hemicordylus capensis]
MAKKEPTVIVVDTDSPEEISSLSEAALPFSYRSSSEVISVSSIGEIPPATPLRPNTAASLENYGLDVISVSSSEGNLPANRENIIYDVIHGVRTIEEICICCGKLEIHTQHPLFHGGICAPCTEQFLERFFLCDQDGYHGDCAICCRAESLIMCDDETCNRCICPSCLDTLIRPGAGKETEEKNIKWTCLLCVPWEKNGVLKRRTRWRAELKRFYDQESNHLWIYQPLGPWEQKPIHVLSLFDNITKELKNYGFLGKGMGNGRLKYLDDVTNVVRTQIEELGPFDFIFGSTPPVAKSYNHPSAWYFYQYYRILEYGRPPARSDKPFFWLFIDNLVLEEEERNTASRFFQMEGLLRYQQHDDVVQNAVHIWSNIPSVQSKYSVSPLYVDLCLLAKNIQKTRIFSQRPATLIKEFFVPLKEYFRTFS